MFAEAITVSDKSGNANEPAALAAADQVVSGMIVGLGSGTTASLVVKADRRADRGARGWKSSVWRPVWRPADLARSVNIAVRELDDFEALVLNIDGADEIDHAFRMIKGRGGTLLRVKLVVSGGTTHVVTVITAGKRVDRLGSTSPIPVEISPIGMRHTERPAASSSERSPACD